MPVLRQKHGNDIGNDFDTTNYKKTESVYNFEKSITILWYIILQAERAI